MDQLGLMTLRIALAPSIMFCSSIFRATNGVGAVSMAVVSLQLISFLPSDDYNRVMPTEFANFKLGRSISIYLGLDITLLTKWT
jgi:hypothetical protein